jgi:hypothetical protein
MKFDKDGNEIITDEEYVKRTFKYPITYFKSRNLPAQEIFDNPANLAHMKLMLGVRGKALSNIYHKIKVFIDGLQTLESTDANVVIKYLENNADEFNSSRVEQIDLKYEKL